MPRRSCRRAFPRRTADPRQSCAIVRLLAVPIIAQPIGLPPLRRAHARGRTHVGELVHAARFQDASIKEVSVTGSSVASPPFLSIFFAVAGGGAARALFAGLPERDSFSHFAVTST